MGDLMQELHTAEDVVKVIERFDRELARTPKQVPNNHYKHLCEEFSAQLKTVIANRTGGLYCQEFKTKNQ